jgi:hypothetical protein
MRPNPRSRIPSITTRHRLKQEVRLVWMTAVHASGVMRWSTPSRVMPALLTSTSMGPKSDAILATPDSHCLKSLTSNL